MGKEGRRGMGKEGGSGVGGSGEGGAGGSGEGGAGGSGEGGAGRRERGESGEEGGRGVGKRGKGGEREQPYMQVLLYCIYTDLLSRSRLPDSHRTHHTGYELSPALHEGPWSQDPRPPGEYQLLFCEY